MSKEYFDTRYIVGTKIGKPLYIKREPKTVQKSNNNIEFVYFLTSDVIEATKCVNKLTAETLLEYYLNDTKSTKSFEPIKLKVTYTLEEESDG